MAPGVTPLVPVAIQAGAVRENPESGPDGVGIREDGIAYTLEARAEVQAVFYAVRTAQTSVNGHGIATEVAHTLDGANAQAVAFDTTQVTSKTNRSNPKPGDPCHPLSAEGHAPAVALNLRGRDGGSMPELSDVASLRAASGGSSRSYVAGQMAVRRLTPRECERLQGFPDDYTKISDRTADGPRYKALGNSMAVPVMRWIGERIAAVDAIAPCKLINGEPVAFAPGAVMASEFLEHREQA